MLQGNPTALNKPQSLSWSWNRADAYGNEVQGAVQAHVEVRYVYNSVPYIDANFASYGTSVLTGTSRDAREVWFRRDYDLLIGAYDDQWLGLGGWTISAHQVYQPGSATLFRGDGRKQDPNDSPSVVHSFWSNNSPTGYISDLAVGADAAAYLLYKGSPQFLGRLDGNPPTLTQLTGTTETTWNDGDPVSSIKLNETDNRNVIVEPSGTLLVSDSCRILRVTPDTLLVSLIAGDGGDNCASNFEDVNRAADGAVARNGKLVSTYGLTDLPDGSIVFLESSSEVPSRSQIRRVKPDGKLETLAGDAPPGASDLSTCSTWSTGCDPHAYYLSDTSNEHSIAAGADGTIYYSETLSALVWQLWPRDGKFHVLAGNGVLGHTYDGLTPLPTAPPQATDPSVNIYTQSSSWLSVDGTSVLIPSLGDDSVRKVSPSGLITRFAGVYGNPGPYVDGLFAAQTPILPVRVVVGPNGYDYTTARNDNNDANANRVVRFRRGDDTMSGSDILVPSMDGSEIYEFDSTGKHLYTRSKYSGATLLTVGYASGQVTSLADVGGTTTITGYGTGTISINSPTGQLTRLTLSGGYLTGLDDPALHHTAFAYDPNTHLLTQMTEPVTTNVHKFGYSASGLLTSDVAPGAGAGTRLTRTNGASTVGIDFSTAENRTTTHLIDMSSTTDTFSDWSQTPATFTRSEQRTQTTLASSNAAVDTWYTDSAHAHQSPDGTTTTIGYAPDPRFGMNLPYATALTVTTPNHPDSGPKCQSGYNGMCVRTLRTASGAGFSATTLTDQRWGSFNSYGTPATTTWTSVATTDCATPPCIVDTSSEQRKVVENLDSLDRITTITLPQNDPVAVSPITITYGAGAPEQGKIVSIQQGSRTYSVHRSPSGFPQTISTPLSSPALTFGAIDPDGRARQETINGGTPRTIGFDFDANGNRTLVTLPNSNSHNFSYNGLNLLGSYDPPPIGYSDTTYDYDLDGLIRTIVPPTDNIVTNTRDAAGRVSQITYNHPTSGTITVNVSYDPATGQPCTSSAGGCTSSNGSASTAIGTVTTIDAYDGRLLTSEETKLSTPSAFDHVVHYDYDNALRLGDRYVDTAAGWTQATFHYDNDSVISSVDVQADTFHAYRGANGMLKCTSVGSVCEMYTYDSYGALIEQKAVAASCNSSCSGSGTVLLDIQYTRNVDPLGRVTAKNETIGTSTCNWSYGYSTQFPEWIATASQTGSTYCGPSSMTQGYDSDGNLNFSSPSWSYDAQDRLSFDGYWTYGYDAQGNVAWQHDLGNNYDYFNYDPVGNLRNVVAGTTTVDYDIDFRDRRVGKVRNNAFSEGYLYDGDRIIGHVKNDGTIDATYVYITKQNVPDLIELNGYTLRVLSDQLGSVRRVVDVSGGLAGYSFADFSFDTYGVATTWPGSTAAWPLSVYIFGFAGGLWDGDVGLYRFGARDYNPWKGRWWSKDPTRFGGGLNLYAYCNDDPVNCTDADGRKPNQPGWDICDIPIVGFIVCNVIGYDPNDPTNNPAPRQPDPQCPILGTSPMCPTDPGQSWICSDQPSGPNDGGVGDGGRTYQQCVEECQDYMGPGASYTSINGSKYKNDKKGNQQNAFYACIDDCLGTL